MFRLRHLVPVVLVALCPVGAARAQATAWRPTATLPSATDARIATFDSPHLSWPPAGRARNQLVLFLPGTGGKPRERFPFTTTAAELGYHVIFLAYPNSISAQTVCGKSKDPKAHLKFRLAILEGGVLNPKKQIEPADSIYNRSRKLLKYLAGKQPDAGWGQFLDNEGQIDWDKVVVAGHSQGGGHAYVISKFHTVARVIMFGSPKDYSFFYKRPAAGFDAKTRTPLKRYFAFNHVKDNRNGCTHEQQAEILRQMGLTKLGVADADKADLGSEHPHVLYTGVSVANAGYHGAVLDADHAVCVRTWKYMLSESTR